MNNNRMTINDAERLFHAYSNRNGTVDIRELYDYYQLDN